MSFSVHTIDLSSGPVHYQKGGSGPPLLHLHSSGGPRVSPVSSIATLPLWARRTKACC